MNRWLTPARATAWTATLCAFGLWMAALAARSLWADEFATNRIMERPDFFSMLAYTPLSERRPPLYYIALWIWQSLAGHNEFSLRYLSLWFSTLSVPAMFALTRAVRRLFGMRDGLWIAAAPVFLALSPAMALFGVMIRNFATVVLLALLLTLAFARWLALHSSDAPPPAGAQRRALWAWLVPALALVFTEYGALALIGAQTLWVFAQARLRARMWKGWLACLSVLFAAFLLLVPSLVEQVERGKLDADLSRDLIGFVLRLATPMFVFPLGETILPWRPLALVAAPCIALLVVRAFAARESRPLAYFGALMVAAPLAFNTFILTAIATDLTFLAMPSRTLYVLPPFLLVGLAGASTLRPRWRWLTWAAVGSANVAALVNLWWGTEFFNPIYAVPLRDVHAYLKQHAQPGDLIISDLDIVYQYYFDRDPIPGTQLVLTETDNLPYIDAQIAARTPPRIWLFIFGRDRSSAGDRVPRIIQELERGYAATDELRLAPTDATYREVKERLIPRSAYAYKLIVRQYERAP